MVGKVWGRRASQLGVVALAIAMTGAVSAKPEASPAVAVVNGEAVPQEAFVLALRERLAAGAQDSAGLREQVRKDLVLRAVLAQQGAKTKLDREADFERQMEAYKSFLLAQSWQRKWLQDHQPTDKDLQKEYERVRAEAGDKEYRIRQVVVRDETSAQLVLDQLKAGKKMSELAETYSIEPLGKKEGGLLPWVNLTVLVPALRDAVSQASQGKVWPKPVQGPGGWHVLMVEDKRAFNMPKMEDIKAQLTQAVAQNQLRQAIQDLVSKSKVELK